jgi:hypothetical protein
MAKLRRSVAVGKTAVGGVSEDVGEGNGLGTGDGKAVGDSVGPGVGEGDSCPMPSKSSLHRRSCGGQRRRVEGMGRTALGSCRGRFRSTFRSGKFPAGASVTAKRWPDTGVSGFRGSSRFGLPVVGAFSLTPLSVSARACARLMEKGAKTETMSA